MKETHLCVLPLPPAGCTLCDRAYPSDCPDHGPVTFVPDTPIESRARLSLPKQLVLRQSIVGAEVGKQLGTLKGRRVSCSRRVVMQVGVCSLVTPWLTEKSLRAQGLCSERVFVLSGGDSGICSLGKAALN